ncbi:MAG: hypothetical protein ACR2JY_15145 [Chloroflexota bacterium]
MKILQLSRTPDYARLALASTRLINGGLALVAPAFLVRRLGVNSKTSPALLYVFRMFGIRTVLIGLDLLRAGPPREKALRAAPFIHASDTTAAVLALLGGLDKRSGVTIVAISAVNTILAVVARPREG